MADTKISALALAATLTGDEIVPIVQAGVTRRTTMTAIAAFLLAGTAPVPQVPATITAGQPLYGDDFTSPTGVFPRANWAVAPAGQTDHWSVDNGFLHQPGIFYNVASRALLGDSLPQNMRATFRYDISAKQVDGTDPYGMDWSPNRTGLFVWYVDDNNYLGINVVPDPAQLKGAVAYSLVVGGNQVAAGNGLPLSGPLTSLPAAVTIDVETADGWLYLWIDGKPIYNPANFPNYFRFDISGQPDATKRSGKVGARNDGTWSYKILDRIAASPRYVGLDPVPPFVGTSEVGATKVVYPFAGPYQGKTPVNGIYRVRDAVTGEPTTVNTAAANAAGWRYLVDWSAANGRHGGKGDLPIVDENSAWVVDFGYVDSDGVSWWTTSLPITPGDWVEVAGQSNSALRGQTSSTLTKTSGGSRYIGDANGAGAGAIGTKHSPLAVHHLYALAQELARLVHRPIGVVTTGIGGQALGNFFTGQGGITQYNSILATIVGKVQVGVWDLGESAADGNNTTGLDDFDTVFLNQVLPNLRAPMATNNSWFIERIGRFANASPNNGGAYSQNDAYREILRQKQEAIVAADPRIHWGTSKLGCIHVDPYHYTEAGYIEMSRRAAYSIAKHHYGLAIGDGRGARATAVAWVGGASGARTQADITFDLDGGTTLTDRVSLNTGFVPTPSLAGGLYGYQASINDFSSLVAISTVERVGTNKLRLTFTSAAPAGTLKVRSHYGSSFDDTELFKVTGHADGRLPIPVWPMAAMAAA